MHVLQWDTRIINIVSHQWKATRLAGATQNMVLPLLSSSCCLVQLLINAMVGAGGCAGFNTILGPVRPIFLALLVGLNILTRASLKQSLWRFALALMPEGVQLWNELAKRQWHNKVLREEAKLQNSAFGEAGTPRLRASIFLEIPTMGCVACINKIDSSLRGCAPSQVIEARSWLEKDKKGGGARLDVFAETEDDLQLLSQSIVKSIDGAGFEGSIVTDIQILPADK
ncbi:MAG: hypothetical protein SGARI_004937 [Bacillariaceae sp.]